MEKLFAFHFNDDEQRKLRQIAATLKIRCVFIEESQFLQPIENLISGQPSPLAPPFTGEVPPENLLLLCDFTDKRMDKLLLALRKSTLTVDYKAVLTPTNQKWNVLRLMMEMRAEKAAYEKRGLL